MASLSRRIFRSNAVATSAASKNRSEQATQSTVGPLQFLNRREPGESSHTSVQKSEEEKAQTKVQKAEEEEAQTKVQKAEEEEAQTKVQKAEEEEAQTKVQKAEEEEAQTKVQLKTNPAAPKTPQSIAKSGTQGTGSSYPHIEKIQAAFGHHDMSSVKAHTDSKAVAANCELGAAAYATGNKVAFKRTPDLHTAAHEAAHVVQQRKGVDLKNGVGTKGDKYEKHADAVAKKVIEGKSAENDLNKI